MSHKSSHHELMGPVAYIASSFPLPRGSNHHKNLTEAGVQGWQGDEKAPPMCHVSTAMALGSAFLYGAAAVSMNFVNKLTLQVVLRVSILWT